MKPLEKTLRNQLERTVKEARAIAEAAAKAALDQLGVGEAKPYSHLTEEDRNIRIKLRAHGRQLGDVRDDNTETQEIERLVEEVAYEHWHRMLFARFLAENNLLMYPDPVEPVPVSLEECEDLAVDEGATNGWELASMFATKMLPEIFRKDSPVFLLALPPEHQQKLERQVADLPLEIFTASDALGWVYQFWQAKKKEEVNASEVKIGERELPAVTQLFTEPYMVAFLLDNSLGAWWVAHISGLHDGIERKPGAKTKLQTTTSEQELRDFFALPGMPLAFLRFIKIPSPEGEFEIWTPAAGTFGGWPIHLSELKALDPCCGSGHFIVAVFRMLVAMRMELEGLSARDAVDAVLRENINGLEIDKRCVEIAAFALALEAWRYPGAGGYRPLPKLNVACSGLSVSITRSELVKLANGNLQLRVALTGLHKEFENAPVLGSLIDPVRSAAAKSIQWDGLANAVEKALQKDRADEEHEAGVTAQGLSKAAQILAGKYHWIVTNVPYLARGKQCEDLRYFCEKYYPEAKNDLATVFLDRCLELCETGASSLGKNTKQDVPAAMGTVSLVLPQNWLFLTSYRKFREKLLKNDTWHLVARLGPGAFETISGEVVKAILITLSQGKLAGGSCSGFFPEQDPPATFISGIDVSKFRTTAEKAANLLTTEIKCVEQAKQLENPDCAVLFEELNISPSIGEYAFVGYGSKPGQTSRVTRYFWEIIFPLSSDWILMESSPSGDRPYCGKSEVCLSLSAIEKQGITEFGVRGKNAWGKKGIAFAKMRHLPASLYCGEFYDDNTYVIAPVKEHYLPAFFAYCFSQRFNEDLRRINQKLNVTRELVEQLPFNLGLWNKVAAEKYPNGLPKPYSDDPTQWIFHGHPCGSVLWDENKKWTAHGPLRTDETVLQVAVARLLSYRWPAELNTDMELANEQRERVNRCELLLPYAYEDGIVCIPPVRGEAGAADRLLNLLAASYGDAWSNDTLAQLLKQADHAGKTLETWLREKFFTQHCKLFHHRPFIWHIWDGLRDGFAALVNYHKLDYKKLETLIYTYLGDWISHQKQDIARGIDDAEEKLAVAEILKKNLELILAGEAPYDIFVRWKPIEKQPIGWNPDLNDGVRLNIRPFLSVPDVGKRGAGILRDKPNIKWEKDRGKDVASTPWHHLFNGDRINDYHLHLAEKRAAQEVRVKEAEND